MVKIFYFIAAFLVSIWKFVDAFFQNLQSRWYNVWMALYTNIKKIEYMCHSSSLAACLFEKKEIEIVIILIMLLMAVARDIQDYRLKKRDSS